MERRWSISFRNYTLRSVGNGGLTLTLGAAGDADGGYGGLDRFGRVKDQGWKNSAGTTVMDDYSYTYDANSNRRTRVNGTKLGRVYWLVQGPSLCAVDPDGGVPYETFLGPRMWAEIKGLRMTDWLECNTQLPSLAMSSDDKFVCFAGFSTGRGEYRTAKPLPCVLRVDVEKRAPGDIFLGKLDRPGKEKDLGSLTAPRGLAVAKGRLYVADRGADRIVAFNEALPLAIPVPNRQLIL